VNDAPTPKANPAADGGLAWTWSRFAELGVDNLYDALALRCRVFILEQGPYLDTDGIDRRSWHLLGRDGAGALLAYLRVVDPGVKYAEPSIGRVITAPEARGVGLGHQLTGEGIARCSAAWPGQGIRISAQLRLEAFYGGHGFERVGEPYLEDGIPHLEMFRGASRAERRAAPSRPGASRETRPALRPSAPAPAGAEPRASFPSGERPKYPLDEGLP
jgi:ElaA protein